jgi:antitoxin VapB
MMMTSEYRAKTFKSGNSVALRLPKGLGIVEGREMKVREEQGRYIVEPIPAAEPKKKIDLSAIAGSMPWLQLIVREEDDYDDLPREWHLLKTLKK